MKKWVRIEVEETLEDKYKKQQRKIKILILIILLMVLGFVVYELKFAEESIFDKGDKYEEYDPNYVTEDGNNTTQSAKDSTDVVDNVISNVESTSENSSNNNDTNNNTSNDNKNNEISIKLKDNDITMLVGDTRNIEYTIFPDSISNKNVTYKISDTNIATVDSNGKITAKKKGTTNITVTTVEGKKSVSAKISVVDKEIKVTGIKSSASSITIDKGKTGYFSYTISPSNATNKNVTYKSSNTSVATVDNNGKITGVSVGTSTITITTTDG